MLSVFLIHVGVSNDFNYSKKDVQNEYKNQETNKCIEIGQIAGAMTMLKWASRKVDDEEHKVSSKEDELNRLTIAFSDKYKALELSSDDVNQMATTIRDYIVLGRMEMDVISFKTYYQTSCELKKDKKLPVQVKDIYLDMNDCWGRETQTGIRAESCIESLVRGGDGTVDSNVKLLVEGKDRLEEKKAELAINNYFNLIIENCTKENLAVDNYICADATFHKASAYVEIKELDMAKIWVKKAMKLLPKTATYVTELAFIYQSKKNLIKALQVYKQAEDIARKDLDYQDNQRGLSRAIRGQGFILIEMGRLKEAKEHFDEALKINPNDTSALHELKYIESLE
jgi:predicted negative regulator of RcsB-dependent stress response